MRIFTEQVSIIRARIVPGDYGGTQLDWTDPEVIPFENPVSVQPVSSADAEDTQRRHAITATHALYTRPPDLLEELRPGDRVRVTGWPHDLSVEGTPAHWRTEYLRHTEVDLKEIHG